MNNQPYSNRTRIKIISAKEAADIVSEVSDPVQYFELQKISQDIFQAAKRGQRKIVTGQKNLSDSSIRYLRDLGYTIYATFNLVDNSEVYSINW